MGQAERSGARAAQVRLLCESSGCCDRSVCNAMDSACVKLASPDSEVLENLPAQPEVDGEFQVVLDKSSGSPLGIDIVYWENNTLLVEGVVGGLVQDWNYRYPRLGIRRGDVVLEVNGVKGDMHRLVDECTKRSVLKLTLRREAKRSLPSTVTGRGAPPVLAGNLAPS